METGECGGHVLLLRVDFSFASQEEALAEGGSRPGTLYRRLSKTVIEAYTTAMKHAALRFYLGVSTATNVAGAAVVHVDPDGDFSFSFSFALTGAAKKFWDHHRVSGLAAFVFFGGDPICSC